MLAITPFFIDDTPFLSIILFSLLFFLCIKYSLLGVSYFYYAAPPEDPPEDEPPEEDPPEDDPPFPPLDEEPPEDEPEKEEASTLDEYDMLLFVAIV